MERAKIWFQQCDFVLDYADMQMYGPRFHLNFYKDDKDNYGKFNKHDNS